MPRGYMLAAATLVVELLLALGLFSDTTGIFAIMGMIVVGIAWVPAAWMIWVDARSDERGVTLVACVIAGACAIAGGLCLWTFARIFLPGP